jgi:deoxyribonuclease V
MTELEQQHLETLQRELSRKVIVPNRENSFVPCTDDELIFTLDVQYVGEEGFVALDVMSFGGEHLGIFVSRQRATFRYIPQFFSFREAPLLLNLIRGVMSEHSLQPSLLLIDGHGLAHPRKFGIASHVGVEMNVPTIGCAKETLMRYAGELGEGRGNTLPVLLGGEEVGRVLRTQNGKNPVFVSVGHLIELGVACDIVLNLSSAYRISEPLRRADMAARAFARGGNRIFGGENSLDLSELST